MLSPARNCFFYGKMYLFGDLYSVYMYMSNIASVL